MLVKAKRWHIVNKDFRAVDLIYDSDRFLLKAHQSCNHCSHHLFAAKTEHTHGMVLRPRGHNSALLTLKSEFSRKSVVNRSLFSYK